MHPMIIIDDNQLLCDRDANLHRPKYVVQANCNTWCSLTDMIA